MTTAEPGKVLFYQAIRDGMAKPKAWDRVPEQTRRLYSFVATCEGPLTGEQLFGRVEQAGLHVNDRPWAERSDNFRQVYNYLAAKCR